LEYEIVEIPYNKSGIKDLNLLQEILKKEKSLRGRYSIFELPWVY
jgi:hypothetical protein